jgi:hypothetical protein
MVPYILKDTQARIERMVHPGDGVDVFYDEACAWISVRIGNGDSYVSFVLQPDHLRLSESEFRTQFVNPALSKLTEHILLRHAGALAVGVAGTVLGPFIVGFMLFLKYLGLA